MQMSYLRKIIVIKSAMIRILHKVTVTTVIITAITLFVSCNTTKHVPDGQYLLNKVRIDINGENSNDFNKKELRNYIRQTPNHEILGGAKFQLAIYNMSGKDSTKWYNKWLRRLGQAPVVYDQDMTNASSNQLKLALVNQGYMDAEVTAETSIKEKKIEVDYHITPGIPHYIESISYNIPDDSLRRIIMADSSRFILHSGNLFNRNDMEEERSKIADRLRQQGYFGFNKEYITYTADTTESSKAVELTLNVMPPYANNAIQGYTDHRPFYIKDIYVITNYDPTNRHDLSEYQNEDTVTHKGIKILYGNERYLRASIIEDNCFIKIGEKYNSEDVDRTYQSFGRLGILKYVTISFEQAEERDGKLWLDSYILLTKGKPQNVSVSLEGTNSEGDLGFGVSTTYQHRNIAKGSETLTTKLGINYESISGDISGLINNRYAEYSGELGISFPKFIFPFLKKNFRQKVRANTEFGTSFTYQERPEYTRVIANAGWKYKWTEPGSMISHTFDLIDINYVYLPQITDSFLDEIAPDNPLLRYSYEDHFIMRTGYSFYYTNKKSTHGIGKFVYQPNIYTIRAGIETAGNLFNLFSHITNQKKDPESDAYKIFGIQYSQYVKLNADYSINHSFDRRNSLVFHAGAGVAIPYGNTTILPFEKRFYSGGANSVRGWSVRTLGPGSYNGNNSVSSFMEQCGDIRLDLNLEYRARLFWVFELAAFIDAGNIWTIRYYENQPGGEFKFDEFYKQIAVAYGLGLRMNFNYFLLRLDCGMKAVNPAEGQERFPLIHPDFGRDFALHFSVGYPF